MTIERLANYPYPKDISTTEDVTKYLERLYGALVTESGDRILDFDILQLSSSVKARAYLAANQADISDDTWTKVTLDTETYDIGNDFDNVTNYRFAAPVAGYYQVNALLTWTNIVADKQYLVAIYLNGTEVASQHSQSSHTSSIGGSISDVIYLTAAQYLELYAYTDAGVGTTDLLGGSTVTFMSVHLLSV